MPQNPPCVDTKSPGKRSDERKMPQVGGNRTELQVDSVIPIGGGNPEGLSEGAANAAGSSLLLTSLQRLYHSNNGHLSEGDSRNGPAFNPTTVPLATGSASLAGNREYDL